MTQLRLGVGIDFSQQRADCCLLQPNGQILDKHRSFANSQLGFQQAKAWVLEHLQRQGYSGVDLTGEATGNYWLPFFLRAAEDPDWAAYDLRLYLLNPVYVHWYKRSLSPDDKADHTDPYYIADRTRTRPPAVAWQPAWDWLALRFFTRVRYHLGQALTREKNFFHSYLFLRHNRYATLKPFSNLFGVTSRLVLTSQPSLEALAEEPVEVLAEQLQAWSRHTLPNPSRNAQLLQRVRQESFELTHELAAPVQQILGLLEETITFLEQQCQQVEGWIRIEAERHPSVAHLASIPGLGWLTASGIAAEIGDLERFFEGPKWDRRRKRYRPKTQRDVEDSVAKFAGLWWPRHASGSFQAEDSHLSKKGNRYLRYYLIEAANRMRLRIPAYQTFYAKKYQEVPKHRHKRALVLTARKGLGLMVGLLHRQENYRPQEA
jgi:hypothetical protein